MSVCQQCRKTFEKKDPRDAGKFCCLTCYRQYRLCGDNRGGNLEADHIKPRYLYPELTFDIENGRTLCKDCHKQTDTWGQKVKSLVMVGD